MNNNFSKLLTDFLSVHLPLTKGLSNNSLLSYCDTFKLFLIFLRDVERKNIERLKVSDFTDIMVKEFLLWLEIDRNCSISTRNQRLVALRTFAKYSQVESPQNMAICQKIIFIEAKKAAKPQISYLCVDDVKTLLSTPDVSDIYGRRDLVLLSVMYDTGARVSEIVDLKVKNVNLTAEASILLTGKGNKPRLVPILPQTVALIKNYLQEQGLTTIDKGDYPLFRNRKQEKFTRAGITYILKKYIDISRLSSLTMPQKVTPHVLRHTKAMHLADANTNPIYIRDILGHEDVGTIGFYIKSSMNSKREALEKVVVATPHEAPAWATNTSMIDWLKNYGKKIM